MRNEKHLSNQLLQAYALGLLSHRERRQVEQHTAVCATCRHALARETVVAPLVRHTLYQAARPTPAQFERMMPTIPRRSMPPIQHGLAQIMAWLYSPLRQPVALAGLLLILLFSGLSLHQSTTTPVWASPSPTQIVATATATGQPTATQTAHLSGTAVPIAYQEQIQPSVSPTPEVTPAVLLSNYK